MRKRTSIVLAVLALTLAVILGTAALGLGGPASETDESKVPHYFGPYPNYANTSFTQADATVAITGDGTGAEAVATVGAVGGANGVITGITITNPGSGYTNAAVVITGAGTGASANATVSTSGSVISIAVTGFGGGYTQPTVTIGDPPALGTTAAATAFGEVDVLTLDAPGSGYRVPTVNFDLPDDPNGRQATGHVTCVEPNCAAPNNPDGSPGTVTIDGIVLDDPGSGYLSAPGVAILDGTHMDPIKPGGTGAVASATLTITAIAVDTPGDGYTSSPIVAISDLAGTGGGATAVASTGVGAVTGITNLVGGSGYLTPGGIRKFVDDLPGLCNPAVAPGCPSTPGAKYIPLGVPDTNWTDGTNTHADADTYVIGLVQYRTSFSSDLPDTLVRGYVQIETAANAAISQHFPLQNELLDGTMQDVLDANGNQVYSVTPPQYLGPTIGATKDRAVRIVFHNYLPTGADGNLFLPVDTTLMGSGNGPVDVPEPQDLGTVMDEVRNPACGEDPKPPFCFAESRATLHLHGGVTPWISDGTPHQWITPAGESTTYPEGVSVRSVPDMDVCEANDDGCQTFYYTNQQSSRLMFYHDHAWGITRLNVYAGEAAGYIISDKTEQRLITNRTIPGPADTIPLIIQDKTFIPNATQLAAQDPTWDVGKWGAEGSLWTPHVYMPAQNPGDPSGMSAFGRWMYGPWFWPPNDAPYQPIANPYYDPACDPTVQEFCEPKMIPGTPNNSVGMEAFNDTPVVNGRAYPQVTLDPKTYRLRILNAANDRFWNLQWYVADPTTGTLSEVALNPAELAAAQTDPVVFPTPDTSLSPVGPSWIQIGTEGGFLPAPVVVPNQPTTWINDPTRFEVGLVDKHSLLLAPAERADTIVDFSKYAGKTLILYNDAPAAFPARVPSYDYYTGGPDLSPVGAPTILPGYGPNTRTIMRVTIAPKTPATTFNFTALRSAFLHKANGSGVFEAGQPPIIVGQAPYNSAYGSSFVTNGWCNAPGATGVALTKCDGYARIAEGAQPGEVFGFNGLKGAFAPGVGKLQIPFEPKGIHDEMNSTNFDEYGRMQANLGLEAPGATPLLQNIILYPFVNPVTEIIDATKLPTAPSGDVQVEPISSAADGTQIWKVTHNGVDTHPIHFHLYDVQILNRVGWDNFITPPDRTELGWKETVRISPLQDTYIALRPIVPVLPFELPNSIRTLNPGAPEGSAMGFHNRDAAGRPTSPILNALTNLGWEYVYHCHILSHEEMDMMRPVTVAMPPITPTGLAAPDGPSPTSITLTWNDNSINETGFLVQRNVGAGWVDLATLGIDGSSPALPIDAPNTHGSRTYTDNTYQQVSPAYSYRIVALNEVGYGGAYMQMTVQSVSTAVIAGSLPAAPSGLTGVLSAGGGGPNGLQVALSWTDNATNETGFVIERSPAGLGSWSQIGTVNLPAPPGLTTYTDTTVVPGASYDYRVAAVNGTGPSPYSVPVFFILIPAVPNAPSALTGTVQAGPQIALAWNDNSTNEIGFTIQRATDSAFTTGLTTFTVGVNVGTYTDTGPLSSSASYFYRVRADNGVVTSAWSNTLTMTFLPPAPTTLVGILQNPGSGPQVSLTWVDNASNETGFTLERSTNGGATWGALATLAANTVSSLDTAVVPGGAYVYRVRAFNATGVSAWATSASVAVPTIPSRPPADLRVTTITRTAAGPDTVGLLWTDEVLGETGFTIQRATNSAFTTGLTTFTVVGANITTYSDTTMPHGATHYYRIRAFNLGGATAWSNTVSVTSLPLTPTNFRSTGVTRASITLAWDNNSLNETGYRIQRRLTGTTAWTTVTTTAANVVSYTNTGRTANTSYDYRIAGVNALGTSPYSTPITVRTLP